MKIILAIVALGSSLGFAVDSVTVLRQITTFKVDCQAEQPFATYSHQNKNYVSPIADDLCRRIEITVQSPIELFLRDKKIIGTAMNNEYLLGLPSGTLLLSREN